MINKSGIDLTIEFLKNPKSILNKTHDQNLRKIDKILKPKSKKVIKFK